MKLQEAIFWLLILLVAMHAAELLLLVTVLKALAGVR